MPLTHAACDSHATGLITAAIAYAATAERTCEPCAQRTFVTAATSLRAAEEAPAAPVNAMPSVAWEGCVGFEGVATGDGRLIEQNALTWGELPLPLRYVPVDVGAHEGAVTVGQMTSLYRGDNGRLMAAGTFDLESPYGPEAMKAVQKEVQNGCSLDLDEVAFEIRVKQEVLDGLRDAVTGDTGAPADAASPVGPDGRVVVHSSKPDDELMVTTAARVRGCTIVSLPAFADARIAVTAIAAAATTPAAAPTPTPAKGDGSPVEVETEVETQLPGQLPDGSPCSCDENDPEYAPECECVEQEVETEVNKEGTPPAAGPELTAGAAFVDPPAAWFANPKLTGPTALQVKDGRVFGHLAVWGTCHISHTHAGCVTPPKSAQRYAYFHTGLVRTREGSEVPVGHITLDTRHAGTSLSAASAAAHYEHTGNVVADVVAGEDSYGIWVSGAVRPSATEAQVRALRAAPLSGDWRRIGGNLELVAALAVNVPGFPVPRPSGLVAGGVSLSLVASGMIAPRKVLRPGTPGALSTEDLRYLKRLVDREKALEAGAAERALGLSRRVRASQLALRVHKR